MSERAVLSFLLFAMLPMRVDAAGVDCADWQSAGQSIMNACSLDEFVQADDDLNAVWRQVRLTAQRRDSDYAEMNAELAVARELPNVWDSVLAAQHGWIAYRDGQCAAERAKVHWGTMAPLVYNTCRTRLTKTRINQLEQFMTERP